MPFLLSVADLERHSFLPQRLLFLFLLWNHHHGLVGVVHGFSVVVSQQQQQQQQQVGRQDLVAVSALVSSTLGKQTRSLFYPSTLSTCFSSTTLWNGLESIDTTSTAEEATSATSLRQDEEIKGEEEMQEEKEMQEEEEMEEEEKSSPKVAVSVDANDVGRQASFATPEERNGISIDKIAEELQRIRTEIDERLASLSTFAEAEALRREYLGKKGPINGYMMQMRLLSPEEKPKLGLIVNEMKDEVEQLILERLQTLQRLDLERAMELDRVDVTFPGLRRSAAITGRRHPLSMTMEKALDIFVRLGYDTVTDVRDSPEIETDYYCFEALNSPKDHPARDMQDTFYLTADREWLLRTHTSSVQIRQLEQISQPPIRIVAPGRVYRKDDIDATHSLCFHQVEILALEPIGELTLGHLKGTVEYFLQEMFGPNIPVRFRGSYFPFTEPSMEVDVFFKGKWLEVLGCGMVDPAVLIKAGIDPEQYSGFAAGFGVERFAMVMHGITDLREFYKNDKRFLQQFPHHYDDGMLSFLSGEPRMESEDEDNALRGTEVPEPFVDSVEELKARQKQLEQQPPPNDTLSKESNNTPLSSANDDSSSSSSSSSSLDQRNIDISQLDIRVGVIQKAWEHPEADKLYCEEVDIGEAEPRQIASGLRAYYKLDELVGQRVLVLANLKARKLMGFPSHGMVLCASSSTASSSSSTEDGSGDDNHDRKVQLIVPPAQAVVGERITVAGYNGGPPATENQILKKKMLEVIFPDLSTNENGVACYKGIPLETLAGPCLPTTLPNAPVS